jgi:CHAT domain-containing protein
MYGPITGYKNHPNVASANRQLFFDTDTSPIIGPFRELKIHLLQVEAAGGRHGDRGRYRHPFYWAGFVLVTTN